MPPIRRPVRKVPYKAIIALICVLLVFGGTLAAYSYAYPAKKIKNGVTICGIDVSKMTVQQAHDVISQQFAKSTGNMKIQIKHLKSSRYIDLTDRLTVDINRCVNKAYEIGRKGDIFTRLVSLFIKHEDILLEPVFDEGFIKAEILAFALEAESGNKIIEIDIENESVKINWHAGAVLVGVDETYQKVLSNAEKMIFNDVDAVVLNDITAQYLYERINKLQKDARLEIANNRQIIHEHEVGISVDFAEIANKVEKGEKKFEVDIKVTLPEVTTEKLKSLVFADTLGEFTTHYNPGNTSRSKNISIAAGKIHGKVIAVGENFSFNSVVGARNYANGYLDANVYVGGKIEQGVGGGICQVSSTIYSAQLYADLQTVSRSSHMFTVSYLPLGQDATVVWGAIDYIFKNNTRYPVKMFAAAANGALTIKILGTKTDEGQKIKIENTVISNMPPRDKIEYTAALPSGQRKVEQQGQNGAVVDTYKIYTRNGKVEKRVFLHRSSYLPMERIILEGIAPKVESGQMPPHEQQSDAVADDIHETNADDDKPDDGQSAPVPEEFLSEDGL